MSDVEELAEETETFAPNPTSVRESIDEALEILANFADRSDKSISRSDLIHQLSRNLSEYYGYIPELTDYFLELFSPAECAEYMDAQDRPRPLVIRTNTLKTNRKALMEQLSKRGCNLESIDWSKVAIKVSESTVPIGATPEYLAGHYMLQSAASLNPVMALAPLPGEKVLDMSAAPGGKTSYVAQLMKNSGTVIANDLKAQRQKATIANLHRLGVKNATVCNYDGRRINQIFRGFDRVLLDAPCSGLGVISRDQSVKLQRTVKDIQRIAHLQKELLRAAVDCVDPKSPTGGVIVYSTCSVSVEENEQVIDYILRRRFVRLIETGLEIGKPGFTRHGSNRFHPSMAMTRRFYPHVHNMDGFYVAKLQKYAHGVRGEAEEEEEEENGGGTKRDSDVDNSENDSEDEPAEEPVKKSKSTKKQQEESEEESADEESSSDSEESEASASPIKKSKVAAVPAVEKATPSTKVSEKVAKAAPVAKVAKNAAPVAAKGAEKIEKAAPATKMVAEKTAKESAALGLSKKRAAAPAPPAESSSEEDESGDDEEDKAAVLAELQRQMALRRPTKKRRTIAELRAMSLKKK